MLTLSLFIAITSPAFPQPQSPGTIDLKGTVTDKKTNQPLAYVSVGILDKPDGTVTDTTGHFSFAVAQENSADSLQISIVGYNTERIAVKDFLANPDRSIQLTERADWLTEVIVTNAAPRTNTEIIGRQSVSKFVQVSIHHKTSAEETIGSEMGMRYKTIKTNAVLKDFNFYVSANNFNHVKFRVNIYALKNDKPDTLLYNKQIFSTVDNFKTGWIKVDLEDYNIKIKNEFIVTIQWIESRMDKKENPVTILPVAPAPFAKNCYLRIASQDKWKRMGVNLSSYVTVAY